MNSQSGIVSLELNSAGEQGERIPCAGMTRLHIQPIVPDGTSLSTVVVTLKKSMFANRHTPDVAFPTAVTITAAEFNAAAIEGDIDVSSCMFVSVAVSTVEGSAVDAVVAWETTDEPWLNEQLDSYWAGGSFPASGLFNGRRYHRTDLGLTFFYDDGTGIGGGLGKAVWVREDMVTAVFGENMLTTGADTLRCPNGTPSYGYAPGANCLLCHFSIQNGQNVGGDAHVTYGNTEIFTHDVLGLDTDPE